MFEPAWPFDLQILREAPLPVAQLCLRAQSETPARRRHDTAFSAFDAFLKLQASLVIAEQAQRQPAHESHAPSCSAAHLLVQPYWNDWLQSLRSGSESLQASGEAGFRFLFQKMGDRFAACRALSDELRSRISSQAKCRTLGDVVELLGTYRNRGWTHSTATEAEFEQAGRCIFSALLEILAAGQAFAGRRFVYVERVEQVESRRWQIEHLDLQGIVPVRMQPLELAEIDLPNVPTGGHLYAVHGHALASSACDHESMYSPSCCVSLHPLLLYEPDRQECFFGELRSAGDDSSSSIRYVGYADGLTFAGSEETTARSKARSGQGDFKVLSKVAEGADADVYRARQGGLERDVAWKQIRPDAAECVETRLNKEIHLLGKVTHPNLIQILTLGNDPPSFTMPFIDGPTLAEGLEALRGFGSVQLTAENFLAAIQIAAGAAEGKAQRLSQQAGLATPEARPARNGSETDELAAVKGETYLHHVVRLVRQLVNAVHALHRAGIVHCNIHPQNILISAADCRPVLIDLSDAQLVGQNTLGSTGSPPLGRLPYMSPEQLLSPGKVDQATDIYNLGVLLWELLTLRPMFDLLPETPSREAARRVQFDDVSPVRKYNSHVPTALGDLVARCLKKDSGRRLSSAKELARLLENWERSEPQQPEGTSKPRAFRFPSFFSSPSKSADPS